MVLIIIFIFLPICLFSKNNDLTIYFGDLSSGVIAKEVSGIMSYDAKTDGSLVLGFGIKRYLEKHYAFEFEFINTLDLRSGVIDGGYFTSRHFLLNFIIQAERYGFTPYIGFGLGLNNLRQTSGFCDEGECFKYSTLGFSWDYCGGIKIYFTRSFSINFDYKYIFTNINKKDLYLNQYHYYLFKDHLKVHSFLIGLSFSF